MIDIKDLEAFLAILDGGSISKAAEDLGLTQPALSLKLKKMETELGIKLFHRTSRNVIPLETARIIEAKVRDLLAKFDDVKETLASNINELRGNVRIGCLMGWFDTLILPAVSLLKDSAPKIRLRFSVEQTEDLLPMLSHGQLDFAIIAQPFEKVEGVTTAHLLDEDLVLVGNNLPRTSSEAARRKELLSRPWVTMALPDSLVEKYWREQFDEHFPWNEAFVPVTISHILALPAIVKRIPNSIAVLPRQIITPAILKETGLEIADAVPQRNGIFLAWRSEALELQRYRIIKDTIQECAKQFQAKLKH